MKKFVLALIFCLIAPMAFAGGITAVYVDADTFTIETDRTTEFSVNRRIKANCGTDGNKYGTILSSSYSSPDTTVNLTTTSDNLTSNLIEVWYGIVSEGLTGSVPEHDHDGSEGSGGLITSNPGSYYNYPDYSETDQGVTGSGATIKAYVDAIGSDTATIYLKHNSGSATTTYILTTSVTIPYNITLDIEPGVIIGGAGTLTINGAFGVGLYQVFTVTFDANFSDEGRVKEAPPQWWGAVGDKTADDTAAIQAAIDSGINAVVLYPGEYRTTATIDIDTIGIQFYGKGTREGVEIYADHTAGPVIQVTERQAVLHSFLINASNTRNAAAVDTTNYGLMIGGATAGSLTFGNYSNILINRQPSHGVYMGTLGSGTIFSQVGVQYGRGHGFMFDDGTLAGDTPVRCGIVKILNCRADENGGNAINLSQSNTKCYRFDIENFEAIDNAWNTAIASLVTDQIFVGGESHRLTISAFGDTRYDQTTMANGDTRLAKGSAGNGVYIQSSSTHIDILNCRFVDITECVDAQNSIKGLRIHNPYNAPSITTGFSIGTSCVGVDIDIPDTSKISSVLLDSGSEGGRLRAGDAEYFIQAETSHFQTNGLVTSTIASGVLTTVASNIDAIGEGDAADSVTTMRFAFEDYLADGLRVRIINENAYNITFNHGTGNVYTKTGANVVVGQNEGITFMALNDKMYEI